MAVQLVLDQVGPLIPASASTIGVQATNMGTIVEAYHLRVLGQAAPWATIEPAVIRLLPGSSGRAIITLTLPVATQIPAGTMPFAVQAVGETDPEDVIVEEAMLDISGVGGFAMEVTPKNARARRASTHKVWLANKGNAAVRVRLEVYDPDEALDCSVEPQVVALAPASDGSATIKVRAFEAGRGRRPFKVEAFGDDGMTQTIDASLDLKPFRKAILLVPLALAVVAIAFVLSRPGSSGSDLTSSQRATSTTAANGGGGPGGTQPGGAPGAGAAGAGGGAAAGGAGGGAAGAPGASTPGGGPASVVGATTPPPVTAAAASIPGATLATIASTTTTTTTSPFHHNNVDLYAWVSVSGTSYTTNAAYANGSPTVARTGAGTSAVHFPGASLSGGNVQVTAYGSTHHCIVGSWYGDAINVSCFSTGGTPVDGSYSAVYTTSSATDRWAYVSGGAASSGYSTAGTSATRPSVGSYSVSVAALGGPTTAIVTPYASDGNTRCGIGGWGSTTINVNCTDLAGAAKDTSFTVRLSAATNLARAWINSSSGSASASYRYNPSGGDITVAKPSAAYVVTFAGLTWPSGGVVVASAYSSTASCFVNNWTGSTVNVTCSAPSAFSLLWL